MGLGGVGPLLDQLPQGAVPAPGCCEQGTHDEGAECCSSRAAGWDGVAGRCAASSCACARALVTGGIQAAGFTFDPGPGLHATVRRKS
mmetsp:Transcript_24188/g.61543  ORF Transcript_24188/g.61543 Transcript_24188/m.61543 type:complete len:88 (+) Transcript_24188:816-1079(+)